MGVGVSKVLGYDTMELIESVVGTSDFLGRV